MAGKVTVALTSHRVEELEQLEEEARKNQVLILEEPENKSLYRFFEGELDMEEYIEHVNTSFPVFTRSYLQLLKELYDEGLEMVQIDPYSQNLEEIYRDIERGGDGDLQGKEMGVVKKVEKRVTYTWLKYHQEFLNQHFDEIVKGTVLFARADAQRFRSKDLMRARHIASFVENTESNILVEAGRMHFLLPEFLKNMVECQVDTVDLVERTARDCDLELVQNPGNVLTEKYILDEKLADDEAKLMAAQGLIYISLIKKEEFLPTDEYPCPHLKDEVEVAKHANSLSYHQCKEEFERIWEFE
ncbi:MAG: hypothetical protein R6U44_07180 [Archaeoglobaceae archaeon]